MRPLGRERTAAVAAPNPLTNPTHGYNVFRPWSLKPAPCPQTCATPNIPLKDWYADLARNNTDVVKSYVIGKSVLGQDIVAYKVTENARTEQDGSRPAVVYNATQHAREWISAEVERRLFEYVVDNKDQTSGDKIADLLAKNELWFVPITNPDGYDYTFVSPATRFWRKNLHDNDFDGAITNVDGVDTNRNWPTKWNYDLEGASADPSGETFHGSGPASEPEVKALRGLIKRIRPSFQIDYHSFAQLILYPEGWQVETPSTDAPLMASLAGDDDKPAVAGFDPDVSAELYTTNGDVTDDTYTAFDTLAYTSSSTAARVRRSAAPTAPRRVRVRADRHERAVERGHRQLGRVPGLERRPVGVRRQAGRDLDHLRQRPRVAGPGRVRRRHRGDRWRRHVGLDVVRDRHGRLDGARRAGRQLAQQQRLDPHRVRRLRRRAGRGDRPLALLGLRPRGRGRPRDAGSARQGRDDAVRGEPLAGRLHRGARSLTPWRAP